MQVKEREAESVARERKKRRDEKRQRVAKLQEYQRKVFRERYSTPDPNAARNWTALEEAVRQSR